LTVHYLSSRGPARGFTLRQAVRNRICRGVFKSVAELVDVHFPKADRIRVLLNNLSILMAGALYQAFPPAEAPSASAPPGVPLVLRPLGPPPSTEPTRRRMSQGAHFRYAAVLSIKLAVGREYYSPHPLPLGNPRNRRFAGAP
jgi:hypothetical protein